MKRKKKAASIPKYTGDEIKSILASIVNGSDDAILSKSLEGKIISWNKGAERLYGYTADEIIGNHISILCPPEEKDAHDRIIKRIKRGEKVEHFETERVTKGGSRIWVSLTVSPIRDSKGAISGASIISRETTKRKRVEEALRKSEEKYRSLVDGANEAILVVQDGLVKFVNLRAVEVAGYSGPDIMDKPFSNFIYPDDRAMVVDNYAKRMKGEPAPPRYEFRLLAVDGSVTWVEINTVVIDWDDKPASLIFLTEITERKQAEEELKFRNLILSTQQEVSIDGILVVGETRKIISCNQRFIDMWAVPPDVMESRSSDSVLQSVMDKVSNPEEFINRVKHLYSHQRETSRDEIVLKDGRTLDRYSAPMFGTNGKYHGRVWYFRDITDRKNAMRVLEVQARMLDSATDSIVLHDKDGAIKYTNEAASRHFGYPRVDLMGMNLAALNTPESAKKMGPRLKAVMEKGKDMFEVEHLRKDGSVRPAEVNARVFTRGDEKLILSVVRDITDRKNAEKEKEKLLSQLLQVQKMEAVGTLAGGVAHDFNNILTAISGFANLATVKLEESNPVHRDLKQISLASAKAAGVVRQLLLFSRKQPMDLAPMDPNAAIIRMLKMLDRIIGEDIVIETKLEKELWRILGDEGNIEQVLMNLAVNAKDAMPRGGKLSIKTQNVTIDKEFCRKFNEARPGRFVCLSISDTGIGMDELTMEHIFEPFFTTKEAGKGTGLGLSVVLGIVQQHKGWITVNSEPGKGATFNVYFPATSTESEQQSKKESPCASLRGKGERILVVEDQDEVAEIAKEMLETNGYSVSPVSNAKEARSLFEKENGNFDLVFSDVVLPDSSGTLLVDELQERWKFGVILTSGYTDEKADWDLIKEKRYRFLPKPYTMQELLQAVKEVLEEKKS